MTIHNQPTANPWHSRQLVIWFVWKQGTPKTHGLSLSSIIFPINVQFSGSPVFQTNPLLRANSNTRTQKSFYIALSVSLSPMLYPIGWLLVVSTMVIFSRINGLPAWWTVDPNPQILSWVQRSHWIGQCGTLKIPWFILFFPDLDRFKQPYGYSRFQVHIRTPKNPCCLPVQMIQKAAWGLSTAEIRTCFFNRGHDCGKPNNKRSRRVVYEIG